MLNKFLRREKGITGLETAIILIAFVVVAAVFAYTALSAGLFTTQKSQEAVYSALEEAQSTMELRGSMIATANGTGSTARIKQLTFTVANVLGGEAIDFTPPTNGANGTSTGTANKVIMNYLDKNQAIDNLYWTVSKLGKEDGDDLLEANEKFQVTIGGAATTPGNLIDALTPDLNVNTTFSIVVMTPVGAVLTLERTTPAYIDTIMNLR